MPTDVYPMQKGVISSQHSQWHGALLPVLYCMCPIERQQIKLLKGWEMKVTQAEAVMCIAKAIICDLCQADLTFILIHC